MLWFERKAFVHDLFASLTFFHVCRTLSWSHSKQLCPAHDAAEQDFSNMMSQKQSCQLLQTCLLFATPRASPCCFTSFLCKVREASCCNQCAIVLAQPTQTYFDRKLAEQRNVFADPPCYLSLKKGVTFLILSLYLPCYLVGEVKGH